MPQGALGVVIGQRQRGMAQDLEDRLPIVEQLHRQGVGFLMGAALVRFAGGAQRRQLRCVLGGQIDRGRAFAGRVHRGHQRVEGLQNALTEGAGLSIQTLSQAAGFADQMGPAAEPVRVMAVRRPAIAHQPAGEAVQHVLEQFLAASGDIIEGHRQ